ncbi:hypothetical protein CEXT_552271 [Caerostris extrusa]|uniref:Secreted protein n=1 Tax=Caerostris extrusa TaxID=172846 RepID=A0AAV4SQS1_CAEEX|nr:hypothetical protein CEXT_552271 [Caerostris extrusa]
MICIPPHLQLNAPLLLHCLLFGNFTIELSEERERKGLFPNGRMIQCPLLTASQLVFDLTHCQLTSFDCQIRDKTSVRRQGA